MQDFLGSLGMQNVIRDNQGIFLGKLRAIPLNPPAMNHGMGTTHFWENNL